MNIQKYKKICYCLALAGLLVGVSLPQQARAAACAAPATDYGSATISVSVPSTTTYRVWSRMSVPDTTNTTYLLEIDGANCYTVGGSGITPLSWAWIDYQSSGSGNKVQLSLSQGAHTFKLIGNAPNVKIDRVIAVSDLNCVPADLGDNVPCSTPADTQAPSVTLNSPSEGATISGTANLTATASDNTGVTKVEFYDNSTLLATDTTTPYAATWDSSKTANGNHILTAKAYDAAGNIGSDSNTVNAQNGDTQAPSTPSGLAAGAPAYNQVKLSWKASTDNVGVTGYTIVRDGVPLGNTGANPSYTDGKNILPNTKYTYQVIAFDAAGNKSAASAKVSVTTPGVPDSQAPSKPQNLSASADSPTQVSLNWTASTDNIGVAAYDVYRADNGSSTYAKIGSAQTTSYGDTNLSANTKYSYYVVARDSANNSSQASDKVEITTPAPITQTKNLKITGTITDTTSGKPIKHALVTINIGGGRHYYQANGRGQYGIRRLKTGHYNLTFRAPGYKTLSTSVSLGSSSIIKDVTLTKK